MPTKTRVSADRLPLAVPIESEAQILNRLRQGCRSALERYVDAASHGSGKLIRMNPASVDLLSRSNLARLHLVEQQAHEAYQRARQALLDFVLGPGAAAASNLP